MASKFSLESILTMHDSFTGPLQRAEGAAAGYSKRMRGHVSAMSSAWKRLGGIATAALAGISVGAAAKAITDFAERADDIARMSNILGLNTTAWQENLYAAKMADLTAEDLAGAFKKMNVNLGELGQGSGSLFTYLKKANPQLALQLLHTKDSATAFGSLMDAIAAETDVQKRAALVQAAFGKGGQGIIEMAGKYRAMVKEAHDSGGILSPEDIAAGVQLADNLKKLRISAQGFLNHVLGAGVRAIGPWVDKVRAWVGANREIINQKIEKTIDWIAGAAKTAYGIWQKWHPVILTVVGAFLALKAAMAIATVVQWALNAAMAANPVGLIILALVALIAIIIVVVRHWKEISAWITTAWENVKTFAVGIWNTVIPYLKALGGTIMAYFLTPINLIISGVVMLLDLLSKLPGSTGAAFKGAADAVRGFQGGMNQTLTGVASGNPIDMWRNAANGGNPPATYASPGTATAGSNTSHTETVRHDVAITAPRGYNLRDNGGAPVTSLALGAQ
jgi:hypothetical protein